MRTSFLCRTARLARASRFHCAFASFVLLGIAARAATFSGNVRDDGLNLGGVRVEYLWSSPVASGSGSVTTDGNGNWSSSGWGPLTTVVFGPSQAGFSFSPPSRTLTTDVFGQPSRSGLNFERISYSISGTVTRGGVGLGGVVVSLAGPVIMATFTASDGSFSFVRLPSGNYTITPGRPGTVFSPVNKTMTLSPSQSGQNFNVLLPTVTTLAATDVAFGDAVLNGRFEGEGTLETRVWFEYGTGGAFNSVTPTQIFGTGSALLPVSAAVSGLSGGVTYNYRLVGANNNGTNYGAAQTFVMPFPPALTAVNLDGINDYVQVGSQTALKVTNQLTVEAWINPTGPGSSAVEGGIIVNKEGEYEIARYADGTIRYALANSANQWAWTNTSVVVPLNQWIHLTWTYDGSSLRLYTNGILAHNVPRTGAIGDAVPTANELRIGGREVGTHYFQGQIDEVRVWNVARTQAEILAGFQRRLFGTEPGLVAYYQFNVVTNNTTPDSGPNGLTATLVNGASLVPSGARLQDPVVTTTPATPVLATTATLRGTVNPSEASTVAYFEYGPSIAYGKTTTPQTVADGGLATIPFGTGVTGLDPGTTYYYRLVAFNSFGTNFGANQTFTTLVLGIGWPISTKLTGGQSSSPKHVLDAEGNSYVAGLFSGSAAFKGTLLPGGGSGTNAFVGKLARGGDWLWATNIPASANGWTRIKAVAIDAAQNVYVAGQFTGTNTFGTTELRAPGETNLFVAKMNNSGTAWLWARAVGGVGVDSANALAVGTNNNAYVAGQYTGTGTFGTTTLNSAGNTTDIFVAKIDPDGNWLWARSGGGTGAGEAAHALVTDSSDNVYVTGEFAGTGTFGTVNLVSVGGNDLFMAKLNTAGTWLLARRGGGSDADLGSGLAIDAAGQIYLVGRFTGTSDYNGILNNVNPGTVPNVFVAKLNSEANLLWYSQAGGGNGFADSITVDALGRVYISGDFAVAIRFGSQELFSAGNSDVFLAQLDSGSGAWNWAQRIGSTGTESRGSIAVDASGSVVVSGVYQNTIEIGYVLLTSPNERDIFLARLAPDRIYEHNNYFIGQAIPVPAEAQDASRTDGGAIAQPHITILAKEHQDSDALNSFVWSIAEHKLYPVRPVTAILKWPLTTDVTNTVRVATAVARTFWPPNPSIHVANTPVDLEPAAAGFPYRFLNLAFTTINGASVDAGIKQFGASQPGFTVLQFLNTGGQLPNPSIHPSVFEVVRTVAWNDPAYLDDGEPAVIGEALARATHNDPTGKNGYVYFESAFYDGEGDERAYNRAARTGPILPVNKDTPVLDDDLVVVWYHTNLITGIAWPDDPVRYLAAWPANPDELVLASSIGSGALDAADFPAKRLYNQPDATLPGYNPNEEHAALYGDVLYALRNDLNAVVGVSEPYCLLKYRDPDTDAWAMKVFKVVTTNATFQFVYPAEAGKELLLPAPLSLLTLCGDNNRVISGPGFQDYVGRLYARAAGPDLSGTNIVTLYWYPLQPQFFYDLNLDGTPDEPPGSCLAWLDRRPSGVAGIPVRITYNVVWPASVPILQIGETLMNAKFGLPGIRNFAAASVIFDQANPRDTNALTSLIRLFDPLSERALQLPANFTLPPGLNTANVAGRLIFTDLPFAIRSRLFFDDLNKRLSFGGVLDEDIRYGGPDNPLLLLNVLSPRERERIKQLSPLTTFHEAIDDLYDLTRNPNRLDADFDGQPDQTLLIGLTNHVFTNRLTGALVTNIVHEQLGDLPKALTAGPGTGVGFVTIVENNDERLSGLPVTLHVIRVDDGPFRGDIKVLYPDNVFDEKLTLRHSGDFGGEPQNLEFEWYYKADNPGFVRTNLPILLPNGNISDLRGWTPYPGVFPGQNGINDITIGDGGLSSLLTLSDNWFICRYRGYAIGGQTNWSDWVGAIGGGEAQLAEGWVKRVIFGLDPFEARTKAFHEAEAVTFASMLQQAGSRYEGDIAFNPSAANLNSIGLIQAYETVLRRAKRLSVEAVPSINYAPANNALLLAASRIADFYMLLGNEAIADAADPTIGFRTDSAGYGTLAPSIFTFQNQLDSLLEEELVLLRGRDDRSATVRAAPVYNRLFWNFTKNEGEVAYAQAYNITDQNSDGFINAEDARIMYPQGHGDAWGHYLTAVKGYYSLLRNQNFEWIPRSESILLAGVPVEVDYLDERKFARAAAAKAKAGGEVVDLTYRLSYVDDPAGQFQGYKDTDSKRAWGLSEWGHRAGSGAFFDWVMANAVLPAVDPNTNHVGLTKIDRTTVVEISEIVSGYEAVQSQVDKADVGLNPLGLAKGVVPFDIDPTLISAGKTHFEQIYDRAIAAMNNTVTVFNHANQLSQALRALQDTVNDFSRNVDQQERDYKNRMIEIFGYPYAGDIGAAGTYPSGYDGPDIYHYMYVNTVELNGETAPPSQTFTAFFTPLGTVSSNVTHFFPDDLPGLQNSNLTTSNILAVSYPRSTASYGLVAPAGWGQRRAPGELQMALSDLLQSETRLKQALINYDNLLKRIDDQVNLLESRFGLRASQVAIRNKAKKTTGILGAAVGASKITRGILKAYISSVEDTKEVVLEALPKVVGFANDPSFAVRGTVTSASKIATKVSAVAAGLLEIGEGVTEAVIASIKDQAQFDIQTQDYTFEVQQRLKEVEQSIREEAVLRSEAFALVENANQNIGRYQAVLAKGLRLMEERIAFRKNAAAETQASRYQDMTFRIFRNDAIQKYRAQFDLAAQYVFLAATAYDFETQLLGGNSGSGREFFTDIIRQRSLGEVGNGIPIAGRHGLADPLARLSQNFGVLKGQLGFNNPQTETGRFSLRGELLRLRDSSDPEWRAELKRHLIADLWAIPEFRRYCRPFAPESAGPQPGLVIRFPTTVNFGLNYFGWPLGGGDNAYDPTLFATKVRSAGVWFENYLGAGLSQTPRVYLVPVGGDVLRSPSGNDLETREWRVVDQKIPVPFPIGFSSLNDSAWIPMNDSLSDTLADIRRFSSFRAYHDSGLFNPSETITDSRLIGRSVWNTDWMLVIPGGTFLNDPNQGLDTFISSVSDIKIFFQTYSYSGN